MDQATGHYPSNTNQRRWRGWGKEDQMGISREVAAGKENDFRVRKDNRIHENIE